MPLPQYSIPNHLNYTTSHPEVKTPGQGNRKVKGIVVGYGKS